jgi:hypothetical protein
MYMINIEYQFFKNYITYLNTTAFGVQHEFLIKPYMSGLVHITTNVGG